MDGQDEEAGARERRKIRNYVLMYVVHGHIHLAASQGSLFYSLASFQLTNSEQQWDEL